MKKPIIALVTDFGTEDGYVAAMKGRILSNAPAAKIVDISHDIKPYAVRHAAYCLNNSYPYFPEKTIFVAVVDPGVGTTRKGLLVKTSKHFFIGPDNGIFSFVYWREGFRAYELQLDSFSDDISPTFHGRDVFAGVAAMVARGTSMKRHMEAIDETYSFLKPAIKVNDKEFQLEAFHIDHFGNMILNFHKNDWLQLDNETAFHVVYRDTVLSDLHETFGAVGPGELLLCWDSSGFLQIAQNGGDAADTLKASIGDQVELKI